MRVIPFAINDKNIIIQKADRYIKEDEIKLAIEDIIKDSQLELAINKVIDLNEFCSCMFSIMYKGIITTIQNINNIEIPVDNMVFEIC